MQPLTRHFLKVLVTVLALALAACEGGISQAPPTSFENGALRFSYPSAWDLQEHEFSRGVSMIVVESAMNGGMIVQYFPADLPLTLDQYAQDFSAAFSENVPVFDVSLQTTSDIVGEFSGLSLNGTRQVVSMGLFGFETGYRLDFFRHQIGDETVFVIFHYSEDEMFGSGGGINIVRDSLEFL